MLSRQLSLRIPLAINPVAIFLARAHYGGRQVVMTRYGT